jgi:HEAT repeat protein
VIARAEFKKLLSDASPRVNADAAVLLYKAGDNDVLRYAVEKLEGASSSAERSSMLYAIGRMSGVDNYPIIKKYLSDPDHNVRKNAILSAGALKAKGAVTDLLDLYFYEMKQCRENLSIIIGALRSIDEFDSTMAALDMLNGSGDDEFRRATLVKIFAHFATAEMAHYIVTYLDDTDDRVRANAIEAVCFLKERGAINSDFVVKNILVSMCDPNSRVVANAVRSLYLCGVVSVISVLREMLLSNVNAVRDAARHAVTYFPDGLFVLNS